MGVDRIRRQHSCDNLVPERRNPSPYNGRDPPLPLGRLLSADEKDNHAGNSNQVPEVAEPETELGWGTAGIFGSVHEVSCTAHPEIRHDTAHLFAEEGADDEAEELEAELLRVEGEFLLQELWDLDRVEHGGEEEDHAVGDCG